MKLAIVSAIPENWISARAFLEELSRAFSRLPELECSVWLVDNGSAIRPRNWNALLPPPDLETHILVLQGHHDQQRAQAIALGYLCCELDLEFDSIVFFSGLEREQPADIAMLVEAAQRLPEAILQGAPAKNRYPISRHFFSALTWLFTGEALYESSLILVPRNAAEALTHSCFTASHLIGAAKKLRIPITSVPALRTKKEASSKRQKKGLLNWVESFLAAVSVFRERVAARIVAFFGLGLGATLISLAAASFARMVHTETLSSWLGVWPFLVFCFLCPLFLIVTLIGVSSFSFATLRRWTPALDSNTSIRSVQRLKRSPYALHVQLTQ